MIFLIIVLALYGLGFAPLLVSSYSSEHGTSLMIRVIMSWCIFAAAGDFLGTILEKMGGDARGPERIAFYSGVVTGIWGFYLQLKASEEQIAAAAEKEHPAEVRRAPHGWHFHVQATVAAVFVFVLTHLALFVIIPIVATTPRNHIGSRLAGSFLQALERPVDFVTIAMGLHTFGLLTIVVAGWSLLAGYAGAYWVKRRKSPPADKTGD
jgi:hypothetical protein